MVDHYISANAADRFKDEFIDSLSDDFKEYLAAKEEIISLANCNKVEKTDK